MRFTTIVRLLIAAVLIAAPLTPARAQEAAYECVSPTRAAVYELLREFGFQKPRAHGLRTPAGVRVFPAGEEADCRLLIEGQDTLWFNGPDGGFYLITLYFAADAAEAASMADQLRL